PLVRLFNFYNSNQSDIVQKRYLAMSDYSQHSSRERMYVIDLANCSVETEKVAHGSGSFTHNGVFNRWVDPEHDGVLNRCSYGGNRQNMTRPGFALIKGYHYSSQSWPVISSTGAKGLKLYALGRAKDENFNLIGRGVVMHEQYYVSYSPTGRSYGCPALKPAHLKPKVAKLIEGALYYSYAPQCGDY
ncbi:MAG: murein L,D-transpeptidase catalytic domain family protein, partial [Methylococcales bacterium]|nr:murein L,D-transpeptidase catalytic domain family protein [Methylococcales bacterium]